MILMFLSHPVPQAHQAMWAFSGLVHGADALPPAKVTRIMRQMRSGPKQLRALAKELEARQEAKCQRREIDLVHDLSAQLDESDRSGETSQRLSRPPFQPRDRS